MVNGECFSPLKTRKVLENQGLWDFSEIFDLRRMWNNFLAKIVKYCSVVAMWNEINPPRAAAHFTWRSHISRTKCISQIPQGIYFVEKSTCFALLLIRMFVFCRGDSRIAPTDTHINIGGELVFSADLCYNGTNKKPSSGRKVARRSRDGRSLRNFGVVLTLL